mmetsp:Transcript_720/g.1139  ORF Transcript_720/g.1139 Transcript_720/m.1139 type:complete len:99 (-) Transcript_720:84-380(-)
MNDPKASINVTKRKDVSIFCTVKDRILDISGSPNKLYFFAQRGPMMSTLNRTTHVDILENAPITIFHVNWVTNCIVYMYLAIMKWRATLFGEQIAHHV